MKNYLKIILLVTLAALLGVMLTACGSSGPDATIRNMFAAVQAKDAAKVGSYYPADVRDEVVSEAEIAFNLVDSITISNLKLTTTTQTDTTASVAIEYDYTVTAFGQTHTEHISITTDLEKVNGQWLISTPVDVGT